jgi:flagellar basal body-associated protein FliL
MRLLRVNVSTVTSYLLVVLLSVIVVLLVTGVASVMFFFDAILWCVEPTAWRTEPRNQTHPYTPHFISTHLSPTSKLIT